jgi:hypothetical protein
MCVHGWECLSIRFADSELVIGSWTHFVRPRSQWSGVGDFLVQKNIIKFKLKIYNFILNNVIEIFYITYLSCRVGLIGLTIRPSQARPNESCLARQAGTRPGPGLVPGMKDSGLCLGRAKFIDLRASPFSLSRMASYMYSLACSQSHVTSPERNAGNPKILPIRQSPMGDHTSKMGLKMTL